GAKEKGARSAPWLGLDRAESGLLDPGEEIVSVQPLVELVRVSLEGHADVRVSGDSRHPYRIKPESEDQMGDERAAQVVRRQPGLSPRGVRLSLLPCRCPGCGRCACRGACRSPW